MSPKTWARAKEIFELAAALPQSERARFIGEHCGDPELRSLVEELLRGYDQTSGILDTPAADLSLFGAASDTTDIALSTGDELAGRFGIVRLIGSGGMGDVYEAEDLALDGARVALKTIRSRLVWDPKVEAQFRKEVYLARKVTHPNVCRIHEFFVHESASPANGGNHRICFYSMELVPGASLREMLRARNFSRSEAIAILSQLAAGLAAAHTSEVVHGDFKAANVLLVETGPVVRAVITDFGLAKSVRSAQNDQEIDSVVGGTPQYMAPEVYQGGPTTPASDVFSFGVVAVETLIGTIPPLNTPESGIDHDAVRREIRHVRAGIRNLILRCLATRPDDRFSDGAALLREWQKAADPRSAVFSRRGWIAAMVAGAAGLAASWKFGLLRFGQPQPALAVLPFHASSPETEQLADGLADQLISSLSGTPNVRVIARSSSFQYKGSRQTDMVAFVKRLGADLLLTAEVSLEREVYQVVAHLYQSADGNQIWRQTFTAATNAAFDLPRQMAAAVFRRLQIAFSRTPRKPPDPAAHEAFLTGNYYWNKRDTESLKRALESFELATRIQPDYAEAWAGVSSTCQMLASDGLPQTEATDRAKAAAHKALALDDQLAAPHMTAALISHRFDWDWQAAIQGFQRAIDLEPQNARAHHWFAGTLSDLGYAETAIREIETAHMLDPLNFGVDMAATFYLSAAKRFDQAIAKGKRVIALDPAYFRIYPYIGLAYLGLHDLSQAMEAYERAYQIRQDDPYIPAHMAYACFLSGQTARGELVFDKYMQRPIPPPPFYVAMVYCGKKDNANALLWLERGYAQRDPSMTMVKVHPALDPVRGEPEYRALLQKMKM